MGKSLSFMSWLNERTQDPTQVHPRPTHMTPPLWTSSLEELEVGGVPHSGPPPYRFGQGILSCPYLPLPIFLDAPNDSAQNFCREMRGGLSMWGSLAPQFPLTFWVLG